MPVITFWSNNKKAIGQTVSAAATATKMAMEHNYKILLVSVDFMDRTIENCFGAQQSNQAIVKSIFSSPKQVNFAAGVNGLIKMAQSNRVTPEIIKDYTKIVYKNRLEVLYSTANEEIPFEEQLEYYKAIIMNAARYYDYVIVDLKKGTEYKQVLEILNMSDVVVLNTEQGTESLTNFLAMPEMKDIIQKGKVLWNICRYDRKSKYNTKNLTRTIWKKQTVYAVPYNTLLFEACGEGGLAELLFRLKTIKTEDSNLRTLNALDQLSEGILVRYKEVQMRG